ncbi:MAG: blue light receptor [Cirrosporium novae-zelandiae]|nr:MAG: blue light receptor [Cirrosporium novae-zelandiae]
MNGFYGRQYDLHMFGGQENEENMMNMMGQVDMSPIGVVGGQTLDEIVSQNAKELQRRRSMHPQFENRPSPTGNGRRASMMEFSPTGDHAVNHFQFDSPETSAPASRNMPYAMSTTAGPNQFNGRRLSAANIGLDTQFPAMRSEGIPPGVGFPPSPSRASMMNFNDDVSFINPAVSMAMDYTTAAVAPGASTSMAPMSMYTQAPFPDMTAESPIHQNYASPISTSAPNKLPNVNAADEQTVMEKMPNMQMSDSRQRMQPSYSQEEMLLGADPGNQVHPLPEYSSSTQMPQNQLTESAGPPPVTFAATADPLFASIIGNAPSYQHPPQRYMGAYSSSGFDMLRALMLIATRPNPIINIGAVDMSCAFVVCDITGHDMPIVYCSDNFERLTGYTKHEILGRNCRFLQSPDGKVQSGVKRKYVDDKAVYYLKTKITQNSEVQVSLINYRKGGQPFMNLLTMIPIPWENPNEIKYFVGFQVDLVEQPNSVTNKNPDGTYSINYQRDPAMPRYVLPTPETRLPALEVGQTIGRDEVSTVLSTIGSGESELSKRIWDKVLLENTDDVVHVLSLKGLFLYLSPACRKVLEYDASELVGTALSSVCHPSDIVPVTRELKETSSGATVDVVFRIRRKKSGYTWFESHGCLHTEQGKGRKCIILVGRERPVYALARNDIVTTGGIGESEVWSKMSTSGMFLFVSSNVRLLLDRHPEELIGTSVQALMRPESRAELGRTLELARAGKRCSLKHEIQNKRGQVLQANTTIFPGDATEGSKPTFLIAQTRLMKMTRSLLMSNKQNSAMSPRADQPSTGSITPVTQSSITSQSSISLTRSNTTQSTKSNPYDSGIMTETGGNALPIGNQDEALASEDNVFDELKTTRSTSWQYELRQMEKRNRILTDELQTLLSSKKKRKRRKGAGQMQKDCANCHTRVTPEWRRGPSGNRDLCNSCGLRWAKQNGRISPRTSHGDKQSNSPTSASGKNKGMGTRSPVHSQRPEAADSEVPPAKSAKLDTGASQAYGSGVPASIQEADEPPEELAANAPTTR